MSVDMWKACGLLISILGCLAFVSCGGSGGSSPSPGSPPVLKNLGIDIEPYDPDQGTAGAFNFLLAAAIDAKVFTVFGGVLTGTTLNPTFEYKPAEGSSVTSMTGGVVSGVGFDEDHQDYSIIVIPEGAPDWIVNYDHVLNPSVEEGDVVVAGDAVGSVGNWYGGVGRTEIQVINQDDGLSYCPFLVFDEDLSAEYQDKVTVLMNDWEEYTGDPDLYDEDTMIYPGCYAETVSG